MSREIMQQTLDALKLHLLHHEHGCVYLNPVMYALEAELAKPEQAKYSDIVSNGGLDPRNKFDAQPEQDHGFDRTASHMAGEYVDTAPLAQCVTKHAIRKLTNEYRLLPGLLG